MNGSFYLGQGVYTVVENSFGSRDVYVDAGSYASGTKFLWLKDSEHRAEALHKWYGVPYPNGKNYDLDFDEWGTPSGASSSRSITITANINDAVYSARYLRRFLINFAAQAPTPLRYAFAEWFPYYPGWEVKERTTIDFEVVNTYIVDKGIEYSFANWSDGISVVTTSAKATTTPTDHTTYTANFNAKPLPPPNVSAGGNVGDPVQVTWSNHPHPEVTQYQIWRQVKDNRNGLQPPELLTTVSSGTTSHTDYSYTVTEGYTEDIVYYDVRSYFSVNGTYSEPNWVSVFAGNELVPRVSDRSGVLAFNWSAVPKEYAVSSYPNPFNPSTNISYQLVEDAVVTLEIFDIVGRKVAGLINDQKSVGYHTVRWDARDSNGKPMSSGVYLYRFLAIPTSGVNATSGKAPFRSSGKLMMTK